MKTIYPKNTPKIVKSGEAQFVNKELLIKLINENGMNATYVSKHVFFDRGKCHAPNKIGDWLKYRYLAKIEDLKAVWQYLDLTHKYDWKDFCFTDYQSPEYRKILFIYTSYKVRKKEERKDAKLRAALGRGSQVAVQGTLF